MQNQREEFGTGNEEKLLCRVKATFTHSFFFSCSGSVTKVSTEAHSETRPFVLQTRRRSSRDAQPISHCYGFSCVCCQYTSLAIRSTRALCTLPAPPCAAHRCYRGNVNKQPKLRSHLACLKRVYWYFFLWFFFSFIVFIPPQKRAGLSHTIYKARSFVYGLTPHICFFSVYICLVALHREVRRWNRSRHGWSYRLS